MSQASILLAPGPVPLHPKVREILSQPAIHHRTPSFEKEFAQVLGDLPKIFQTKQPVITLTSTGTGAMEALVVNCFNPGDRVVCIIGGKFGERFRKISKIFGLEVITIEVPWGEPVRPSDIETVLHQTPNISAVLLQACETSTATAHPIEEIGKIIQSKFPEVLFLVDGITAIGAYDLKMDEWGIDGLIGGSQKAFMLPVGLSFVALSEKGWQAYQKSRLPRFYLDLGLERKANESNQTHFSSPVHLLRALNFVLKHILEKGLSAHFAEIKRRQEFTLHIMELLGLESFSKAPAPSVTALRVPSKIDGKAWRKQLEEKHGVVLMGGQDQLLGKILRIGHMGYILDSDLLVLAEKLCISGSELGHSTPDISQFMKEAQEWLEAHK